MSMFPAQSKPCRMICRRQFQTSDLVSFRRQTGVEIRYLRTLKGNETQFELAKNSSYDDDEDTFI